MRWRVNGSAVKVLGDATLRLIAQERVEVVGLVEVVEREGVDALYGVGEVGVDLEAVEVADDQERRIFEVFLLHWPGG